MGSNWKAERPFFALNDTSRICPVVAVHFDPIHEILWASTDERVSSFSLGSTNSPYTEVFTRFKARNALWDPISNSVDTVQQMFVHDLGVYVLSKEMISLHSREGMTLWKASSSVIGSSFESFCPAFGSSEIVASSASSASLYLLQRGIVTRKIDAEDKVLCLTRNKLLACGTASGAVILKDTSSLRTQHCIKSHAGSICDIDWAENYVSVCANVPGGRFYYDQIVNVYDARRTDVPVRSIPVPSGAKLARFHPLDARKILICSMYGNVMEYNITKSTYASFDAIKLGSMVNSFAVSSSGNKMAIGDSTGLVNISSCGGAPTINFHSQPITKASPVYSAALNENEPLSSIGMPYYNAKLLSAQWFGKQTHFPGNYSNSIPVEILDQVRYTDYVGFAPNLLKGKRFRNQVEDLPLKNGEVDETKFRSNIERDFAGKLRLDNEGPRNSNDSLITQYPSHYHYQKIHYSKFGVEDFDFSQFNSTEYSGLENNIKNSYCNALLQTYIHGFKEGALKSLAFSHLKSLNAGSFCKKEFCLLCEFGFLCRMAEDSKGSNCQATNFFRALNNTRQVFALGLLEPTVITPTTSLNLLVQNMDRFLLDSFSTEFGKDSKAKDSNTFQNLCGLKALTVTTCSTCKLSATKSHDTFSIDFHYKAVAEGKKAPKSFLDLVRHSLRKEITTKAWCDNCKKYSVSFQEKYFENNPDVLNFHFGGLDEDELGFWENLDSQFAFDSKTPFKTFIPPTLSFRKNNGIAEVCTEQNNGCEMYEVSAFICQVQSGSERTHLVSFSKNKAGEWILFNDFLVQKVTLDEVLQLKTKWKIPSIIQYQKVASTTSYSPNEAVSLVTDLTPQTFQSVFRSEKRTRNIDPIRFEELKTVDPSSFLIGIDAEFVLISKDETEAKSDGTKVIVRPGSMSLARISLVREDGSPFVDDYITTSESVLDYLTEYSGIRPKDLDVTLSPHNVIPLKDAYRKLRLLVDMGFVFVGHGLRKDFRTINIFVPRDQVVDTVDIYRQKGKRNISLRFLAWYVLGEDIQSDTHDSIVDAKTVS